MQGRDFSFRFELAARNKQESDRIIEIIEWFKRGMHPDSKAMVKVVQLCLHSQMYFFNSKICKM